MRSIKELINKNEVIWFSIGSDQALRSQFMQEAAELGIDWVSGRPVSDGDRCGYFMGIGPSPTLGYVSWQIWRASWLTEEANPEDRSRAYSNRVVPIRVDYGKYTRGDEDYLVTENVVKNVAGFTYPIGGRVIPTD